MEGRVSIRRPNGKIEVFAGDLPAANGISIHNDRIFVDECRPGGRLWELSPSGGSRRLIAENLPAPNALSLGPDDYLYFPVIFANEIWRVPAAGGQPERFVGDIHAPVAVKFDSQDRLVTVSSGTGDVLRYDLPTRERVKLGRTRPGIDNFAIDNDDRLFISHFTDGGVSQLNKDGSEHVIVEAALPTPWGIAFDRDGDLIIADGLGIMRCSASGASSGLVNLLTDHGFPAYARNLVVLPDGSYVVANSGGSLFHYVPFTFSNPLASELGQVMGMAVLGEAVIACAQDSGRVVRVSKGQTEVLASNLEAPCGVAVGDRGEVFVGDAGSGNIVQLDGGRSEIVASGFLQPQGMVAVGGSLFVADRAQRAVFKLTGGKKSVVAENLPFGRLPGVTERIMPGVPGFGGPITPFTGLASDGRGNLYASADGDCSVLKLTPQVVNA